MWLPILNNVTIMMFGDNGSVSRGHLIMVSGLVVTMSGHDMPADVQEEQAFDVQANGFTTKLTCQ